MEKAFKYLIKEIGLTTRNMLQQTVNKKSVHYFSIPFFHFHLGFQDTTTLRLIKKKKSFRHKTCNKDRIEKYKAIFISKNSLYSYP